MTRSNICLPAALLTCLLLAACCRPAFADEIPSIAKPDDAALNATRDLADEVMRKAGGGGRESLDEWTRSILDRALDRAGGVARQAAPDKAAEAVLLPAERHASGMAAHLADRPGSAEILLFTSLSVPAASWPQWAHEAALVGAPLVLRGVTKESLKATVKRVGAYLDESGGAAIDPRLFRLFAIDVVPAVAVVPGGVPPCSSKNCSKDPPPPHDLVKGNIGLDAALRIAAAEDGPGRGAARRHLARLRGDFP